MKQLLPKAISKYWKFLLDYFSFCNSYITFIWAKSELLLFINDFSQVRNTRFSKKQTNKTTQILCINQQKFDLRFCSVKACQNIITTITSSFRPFLFFTGLMPVVLLCVAVHQLQVHLGHEGRSPTYAVSQQLHAPPHPCHCAHLTGVTHRLLHPQPAVHDGAAVGWLDNTSDRNYVVVCVSILFLFRSVASEEKSFAIGIQFLLMRVLGKRDPWSYFDLFFFSSTFLSYLAILRFYVRKVICVSWSFSHDWLFILFQKLLKEKLKSNLTVVGRHQN